MDVRRVQGAPVRPAAVQAAGGRQAGRQARLGQLDLRADRARLLGRRHGALAGAAATPPRRPARPSRSCRALAAPSPQPRARHPSHDLWRELGRAAPLPSQEPWVLTLDNFLTDEECDHIVSAAPRVRVAARHSSRRARTHARLAPGAGPVLGKPSVRRLPRPCVVLSRADPPTDAAPAQVGSRGGTAWERSKAGDGVQSARTSSTAWCDGQLDAAPRGLSGARAPASSSVASWEALRPRRASGARRPKRLRGRRRERAVLSAPDRCSGPCQKDATIQEVEARVSDLLGGIPMENAEPMQAPRHAM